MKWTVILIFMLVATGCATICPPCKPAKPVTIHIPLVTCPPPPELVRPELPIDALKPGAAPAEVMRAYVSTTVMLMGYVSELETVVDAYKQGEVHE